MIFKESTDALIICTIVIVRLMLVVYYITDEGWNIYSYPL